MSASALRPVRPVIRLAAATFALVSLFACSSDEAAPRGPRPSGSILAVGDTGEPWGLLPSLFEAQLAVGQALAHADREARTDAYDWKLPLYTGPSKVDRLAIR